MWQKMLQIGSGGEPVSKEFYLYKDGDEMTTYTDGWSSNGYRQAVLNFPTTYSVNNGTNTGSVLYCKALGDSKITCLGTQKAINLNDYNTLKVEVSSQVGNDTMLYITNSKTTKGGTSEYRTLYPLVNGLNTVDISDMTIDAFVAFAVANTSTRECSISKMWLE